MRASLRSAVENLPLSAWIVLVLAVDVGLVLARAGGWDSAAWAQSIGQLQQHGYGAAVAAAPPLQVHWLWFCARLLALAHVGIPGAAALRLLLLAPVLLCHLLLLLLIHRLLRPQPAGRRTWLIGLAALNSALLIDGPWLGHADPISCLLLAVALHLLIAGRRLLGVLPLLLLAQLLNPQAICLLPVLLPLLWRRSGPWLWAGLLPMLLLAELVLLPYWLAGSTTAMLRAAYAGGMGAAGAHNLWALLSFDQAGDALPIFSPDVLPGGVGWLLTPLSVGAGLLALWSLCLLVSTWRSRQAADHWRNAVLSAMGYYLLLPQPHAGGLMPAAVLAVVAAALHPSGALQAVALSVLATLDLLPGGWGGGIGSRLLSAALLAYGAGWLTQLAQLRSSRLGIGLAAVCTAAVLALAVLPPRASPSAAAAVSLPPGSTWLDATGIPGRSDTQGWGSLHLGQSVEGRPLRAGGRSWSTGFGTHAPSIIQLPVPAGAARFVASAGLDDEVSGGRLAFRVFADRQLLWDSGPLLSGQAPRSFDLDVAGRTTLELVVDPLGDNSYDHADWLEPRFVMSR